MRKIEPSHVMIGGSVWPEVCQKTKTNKQKRQHVILCVTSYKNSRRCFVSCVLITNVLQGRIYFLMISKLITILNKRANLNLFHNWIYFYKNDNNLVYKLRLLRHPPALTFARQQPSLSVDSHLLAALWCSSIAIAFVSGPRKQMSIRSKLELKSSKDILDRSMWECNVM